MAPFAGEREAVAKKQLKANKKQQKEASKGILATNRTIKKKSKFGGVRIRKGVTVKVEFHNHSLCRIASPQ